MSKEKSDADGKSNMNEIATSLATNLATKGIEAVYGKGSGVIKGLTNTLRVKINKSYTDYLQCVDERYSKAKSFFIKSEAIYLYEFYIPTGMSCGNCELESVTIVKVAEQGHFMVLMGGGGSGKSMLMRHLFLDTLKTGHKVPVFLELRHLNEQNKTLLDFINATLRVNKLDVDDDYIEKAMQAGHFVLLLDGFDEVLRKRRKGLSKEIQELQKKYDKNMILVSSRADNIFAGWEAFIEANVSPLNLDQAVRLVKKVPFDNEIKTKFVTDLQSKLFEKHESFLSNPLLLSIMLLTYSHSADIPSKLSVFYSQAYEALFQRHDALKGGFQRERLSGLDIQDFARVFSAFAIQTYDARKFSMTKSDALDYLEKSKKLTGINFNSEDYLADAHQAVSMLVEEGLHLSFTHRSFQEYFTAKFISGMEIEQQRSLLKKYAQYYEIDDVFDLLYEMKPDLMEKELFIPCITGLEERLRIRGKVGLKHFLNFLKLEVEEVHVVDDDYYFIPGTYIDEFNQIEYLRYVLSKCENLLPLANNTPLTDDYLIKKYNKEGVTTQIIVNDLTLRSEFLIDLSKSEGFFSMSTLEKMLAIKKLLIKKHAGAHTSLSQILKI